MVFHVHIILFVEWFKKGNGGMLNFPYAEYKYISDGDKICLHCYYLTLLTEFLFIRYSKINMEHGKVEKVQRAVHDK